MSAGVPFQVVQCRNGLAQEVSLKNQQFFLYFSNSSQGCAFVLESVDEAHLLAVLRYSKQVFDLPVRKLVVKGVGNSSFLKKVEDFLFRYQKSFDAKKIVTAKVTTIKVTENRCQVFEHHTGAAAALAAQAEHRPALVQPMTALNNDALLRRKIRVLIVDDSRTMQLVLTKMIVSDERFEIAGTVTDPTQVAAAIEKNHPDVVTLDMNMEPLNGVEVLKQVGHRYKVPTVVVSALTLEEGSLVLQALELGAVDYFPKPAQLDLEADSPALCDKLFMAAQSRVHISQPSKLRSASLLPQAQMALSDDTVILLGASTGGTEALRVVLTQFPENTPPVLVVQHIPPVFSRALAERLNSLCPGITVLESQGGERLQRGYVYIAPGDRHLTVENQGGVLKTRLSEGDKVSGHKPSVDVLFQSGTGISQRVVAALLTGMGRDGAEGMKCLRQKGARTIAQSEKTCVVYGMPRAAVENGGAECTEDLENIPQKILQFLKKDAAA